MIIIFVSLLQTPLQRTRTLTAFYVTILPFCFFAKYAERKYFQDPLDKHLNKSKLFGGRKLYPDTWTGALWWNVVLIPIWLKIKICEITKPAMILFLFQINIDHVGDLIAVKCKLYISEKYDF